jgi:PIN domain nuclease of toxin-antitoxin system
MPAKSLSIFLEAEEKNSLVYIPAISCAEIGYLYAKHRIECSLMEVKNYVDAFKNISIISLSMDIIFKAFELKDIPELHDKLIAGTALKFDCPLITNDPIISASKAIQTIW